SISKTGINRIELIFIVERTKNIPDNHILSFSKDV
ncbi:unnamed protein product, partial [marine sediment metagenome]